MSVSEHNALLDDFAHNQLHLSVINDDLNLLQQHLSGVTRKKCHIDLRHSGHAEGHTPLSLSVVLKRYRLIEYLTRARANVLAKVSITVNGQFRSLPIAELIAECSDDTVMAAFIAGGADVAHMNFMCHRAAANANPSVLALVLSACAPFDLPDADGCSPCHVAARNTNDDVIALLIAYGCDVNRRDRWGRTPLFGAASNPNQAVIARLIACNANVNAVDDNGKTPLIVAASNGNEKVFAVLVAAGARADVGRASGGLTLCHLAVTNPNEAVLRQVIALGVDVNARDDTMRTPSHIAAKEAGVSVLQMLLHAGASFDAVDDTGKTMCHYGAMNADPQVLQLILTVCVDVDARDQPSKRTACHIAAGYGRDRNVLALLDAGADLNAVDGRGLSAMAYAAELPFANKGSQQMSTMQLLFRRGADARRADKDGRTPLHRANMSAMTMLFAHGIDMNVRDNTNLAPLHVALCRQFDTNMFARLVAAGADPTPPERGWPNAQQVNVMNWALLEAVNAVTSVSVLVSEPALAWAIAVLADQQHQLLKLRAFEVGVGLQSLELPALLTCEILSYSFAPLELQVPLHHVWNLAVAVKHFLDRKDPSVKKRKFVLNCTN
jgi:ankyrin repeat protein